MDFRINISVPERAAPGEETVHQPSPRLAYKPPQLVLYGSLTELTGALGSNIFDGLTATDSVS